MLLAIAFFFSYLFFFNSLTFPFLLSPLSLIFLDNRTGCWLVHLSVVLFCQYTPKHMYSTVQKRHRYRLGLGTLTVLVRSNSEFGFGVDYLEISCFVCVFISLSFLFQLQLTTAIAR